MLCDTLCNGNSAVIFQVKDILFLFISQAKKPISRQMLDHLIGRYCRAAKVNERGFHALKRQPYPVYQGGSAQEFAFLKFKCLTGRKDLSSSRRLLY